MTLLDKKFKGAALIMALFVTAIIASVSAGLFSMVSTNLENEKNMISEQQAILTTLSLESFTKKYLNNKENRNNIVLAANNFSQKSPINLPLERGNLEANIVDMGQCFNLNSLISISATGEETANQENLEFFKNLMKSLFIQDQKIEEISPLNTTTPSLIILTLDLLFISPLITFEPAIFPAPETLNIF